MFDGMFVSLDTNEKVELCPQCTCFVLIAQSNWSAIKGKISFARICSKFNFEVSQGNSSVEKCCCFFFTSRCG